MKERREQNGPRKRLDIHDVARRARVSIATVSRTVNGVATVDKELARRVWKAIRELDYVPNPHARALISGHSRLLAVLVPEITNPFFPELIQGFEEIATASGYEVLIVSTSGDAARMKECIRRILERNVEGAAVMTFGTEGALLDELGKRAIPMVFVDSAPQGQHLDAIQVDYQRGIREGVQHLAILGHRKIGFISGPAGQLSAQLRKEAFLRAVREVACMPPAEWVLQGNHTLEGGMEAMRAVLLQANRPTAVMCSNDMTAIGALRILTRNGIAVPAEMSIIGFDDIHLAEFVHPPLTTVRMSRLDLARAAVHALREHIEKQEGKPTRAPQPVATTLTVRESTSYAPKVDAVKPKANGHAVAR